MKNPAIVGDLSATGSNGANRVSWNYFRIARDPDTILKASLAERRACGDAGDEWAFCALLTRIDGGLHSTVYLTGRWKRAC